MSRVFLVSSMLIAVSAELSYPLRSTWFLICLSGLAIVADRQQCPSVGAPARPTTRSECGTSCSRWVFAVLCPGWAWITRQPKTGSRCAGAGAVVHRSPGAGIAELWILETAQGGGRGPATDLSGQHGEEAYFKLETFTEKWDGVYPTIGQMWRRNWEHLTPFFAYPGEIRKVIYTTNAIESPNMSLRK